MELKINYLVDKPEEWTDEQYEEQEEKVLKVTPQMIEELIQKYGKLNEGEEVAHVTIKYTP